MMDVIRKLFNEKDSISPVDIRDGSAIMFLKETILERAAFWDGWSELSWSGRAHLVLA